MRKLFVLTLLLLGYGLTAWSQSGGSLQSDSGIVKIGFPKTLKLSGLGDSLNYKQFFNNKAIAEIATDSKNVENKIYIGHPAILTLKAPHNWDNMPCMNPQGNFPMPVYRPDSTMHYTLLIK